MNFVYLTGNLWTRRKATLQPEEIQKPSDFLPGDATPQDRRTESEEQKNSRGIVIFGSSRFLNSTEFGSQTVNCLDV